MLIPKKQSKIRNVAVSILITNAILAVSPTVYANDEIIPQAQAQEQRQTEPSAHDKGAKDAKDVKEKKKDKALYEKTSRTRAILKSVLNLKDAELDAKLAEHDNNIYKLLKQANKVEEYKTAVLDNCKEILDKMVAENKMTRAEADNMYVKARDAMENFSESNFGWGVQEKQEKQDRQNKQETQEKQDRQNKQEIQEKQDKKRDNTTINESADAADKSEERKEGIGDKINKWRNKSKNSQNTADTTEKPSSPAS